MKTSKIISHAAVLSLALFSITAARALDRRYGESPPATGGLLRFLRADESRAPEIDRETTVHAARLPGSDITLIYVQSRGACGTGGCTLEMAQQSGKNWKILKTFPATVLPITLLSSRHKGLPDLGVMCRCDWDGDQWIYYPIRMRFDGRRYTRIPRVRLAKGFQVVGKVLIARDEQGVRLFR
jgi:hypothetical protein